jgi:hypothetical protein
MKGGNWRKELSDKPAPEQFLAVFPLEIRSIAQALQELVRAQATQATVAVYPTHFYEPGIKEINLA